MEGALPSPSTSANLDRNVGSRNQMMPTSTTTNNGYLVCASCHGYVSMPPLYTHDHGKTYCGRCTGFRDYSYEEISRYLTFPCIYRSYSTPIRWGNVEEQEEKYLHRAVPCPIVECTTLCDVNTLESHFNACHTELIHTEVLKIADSVLRNPGNKVFLLVSRGIPAIVLVSDVTKDYDIGLEVSVGVFCVVNNFDANIKYNAEFTLDSETNSTTMTVKNQQIQLYRKPGNRLIRMVNIFPYPSVMTKPMLTVKLHNPAEEQQRAETVANLFNCPICYQFMSSRIFQCKNGHSFCEKCKKKMAWCPHCRGQFGPRNYLLEDIRRKACPGTPLDGP